MTSENMLTVTLFTVLLLKVAASFENKQASTYKVTCYHEYSNHPFNGTLPETINTQICTHIIMFGCETLDGRVHVDPNLAKNYFPVIPLLKKMNPSLKVLCCNYAPIKQVLATEANRTLFATSAAPVMRKYGFDGFDLDWEFPAYMPDWNLPGQKHNFSLVVQALRKEFEKESVTSHKPRLLLTAAVGAVSIIILRSYEVPQLAKSLDFINLMTYDTHYYLPEFPFTGYNSPLHPSDDLLDRTIFRFFNTAWSANQWAKLGMNKSQIIVGVPFYGHTYTLEDPARHGLYDLAKSSGSADEVGYYYICHVIADPSSKVVWDNSSMVPYVYRDALWISYDDVKSISDKVKWTLENQFGGTMVFSLNSDDFAGSCKTRWPLLKTVNSTIHKYFSDND